MKKARTKIFFAMLSAVVAVTGGCGGGSSGMQSGKISLGVTDAPLDSVRSVVVQFNAVAFKRTTDQSETTITLNPSPQQVDLMQYRDGRTAMLMAQIPVPAGDYEWVRLIVDNAPNIRDSFVVLNDSSECELRVPSGAESGLKLNRGFSVPADGNVALTVDFDLRKSIHSPPGQSGSGVNCTQGYLLRPTLRLVDNANVGAIAGHIAASLVAATCHPAVYVFQGSSIVPDDIEETSVASPDVDPYATASVTVVPSATQYSYQIAFLPPGNYSVAFTCTSDDPTADEALVFSAVKNVTVQSNLIATADF